MKTEYNPTFNEIAREVTKMYQKDFNKMYGEVKDKVIKPCKKFINAFVDSSTAPFRIPSFINNTTKSRNLYVKNHVKDNARDAGTILGMGAMIFELLYIAGPLHDYDHLDLKILGISVVTNIISSLYERGKKVKEDLIKKNKVNLEKLMEIDKNEPSKYRLSTNTSSLPYVQRY